MSDFIGKILNVFIGDKIVHQGNLIHFNGHYKTRGLLFWGFYEKAELRFVRIFLRNNVDTIELGSSIGVVSNAISKKLKDGVKLVCVEPNPEAIFYWQKNVEHNNKNISIMNRAISYSNRYVFFSIGETNLTSKISQSESSEDPMIKIEAITLSEVLKQNEIVSNFQLVCDIEGSEVELLMNEAASLKNCSLMILESHNTWINNRYYDTNEIIATIEMSTNMKLVARYGENLVFANENV